MDADPTGHSILFSLSMLLFFTLMNAFFAAAEMAVVSVNKNRIHLLAEEGNKKATVIEGLFDDSTRFLSTIQVAITFAGFYSSASAASNIAPILGTWLTAQGVPYGTQIAGNGVTLLLMFFNLVFGELVPKRIALQKAEGICMWTVMPIHYISIILSPFIKLLSLSTRGVLRLLGMATEDEEEAVTKEEIKALMKQGTEAGTFDDEERKMVDSVIDFNERTAKEIRVPRRDVMCLDINDPFEEVIDELLASRHNRIPVYDDDIDNIIGVLHMKDVALALRQNIAPKDIPLRRLLREPFFVPEMKATNVLFQSLQHAHQHMAILVDEHGGFSGIVTVEDLVESIVGDIDEEYDIVEPEIVPLGNDEYLLDGGLLLNEFNKVFESTLSSDDVDTMSGFVVECLGELPAEGAHEEIQFENYVFATEEVRDNHIAKIRFKILPIADET
ncbi:MAG: hemolysin family protein [Peptococcaceae bacterium]